MTPDAHHRGVLVTMTARPSAIGGYEDWPAWLTGRRLLDGDALTTRLAAALGVPAPGPAPVVRTVREWDRDGVTVAELEWSTGVGPPTRAWTVRPARADGPLPGVLLLHCHAGVKSVGAERLVRTPEPTAVAEQLRRDLYEGRAFAEDLARRGFVVLAHDTFGWGSRRFVLDPPPASIAAQGSLAVAALAGADAPTDPDRAGAATAVAEAGQPDDAAYDVAAGLHEHVVAKAAGLLGTSFAGMVAHDDLVAASVLRALPGVDPARTGAAGFSGGGGRAATLAALDPQVRASAVVAMMTTTAALFPAFADAHSWLLATPGLLHRTGLPEIAAARGAHDLLVLSFDGDELFPPDGVRAAHAELRERFPGAAGSLEEAILPGGHVFSVGAQERVGAFLERSLAG
ncbi:acetylesterase [Georgenia sp. M64]|uniref:acetylesterase n=1 Tax=Georgenia sp. M64 TaxID=3120520 RepID=UPI0030E29204